MTLSNSEKNAFRALENLFKYGKIKVTSTALQNALLQHSEFPKLTSLSDVLTEFDIPNLATRLDFHRLSEIPLPAIAHFDNGLGYITIIGFTENGVEWVHDQLGKRTESLNAFNNKWKGITLLIEAKETSGEELYLENRKNEIINSLRIPFVLSVILIAFSITIYRSLQVISFVTHWEYYTSVFSKLVGLIVSSILVWYSFDSSNPFVKRVCELNNRTNCSNILNSKAAKFLNWLTWSEIGFFYFGGGLIALLINPENLNTLKILNLTALPYTIWSIYYQWRIAKEWCVLCLSIQVILWVEFYIFQNISLQSLLSYLSLSSFFILPTLWVIFKKPLESYQQIDGVRHNLQKIKFNTEYVNGILSKEKMLPPIFETMKPLAYGNLDAKNTITMVITPDCNSCRKAYNELQDLLKRTDSFKCRIIFAATMDSNDIAGEIVSRILSLPTDKQQQLALMEWFKDDSKISRWIENTNIPEKTEEGLNQLNVHLRWINLANITETPTVFLNSAEIPVFYKITEFLKIVPSEVMN
jgi:uncharacterized membrane protein